MRRYSIILNEDLVHVIESDLFITRTMYVSVYNPSGLGITDQLKIYKNGTRISGGATIVTSNSSNILITDFFDFVLYNETIYYAEELNIQVNVITVIINNNFSQSIYLRIKLRFSGSLMLSVL